VLSRAAAERGATVVHGVSDVGVSAGAAPSVRYVHGDSEHDAECRLIVGADGRHSSIRKSLDIAITSVESKATLGGLLVHTDDWHSNAAFVGEEGEQYFLAFPRPGGYVRLYSTRIPSAITSGPDRARHLLEGFRLECVPLSERLAEGEVAGPCAYVLGSDAWTDNPAVVGAVLIGDAAGWSDPILGCGLSVAMRDARSVSDVLLAGDDWSPQAFEPYAVERAERMRRIRMCAHLATELSCTFTPEGRARRQVFPERMASDPLVFGLRAVALVGPERASADSFTEEVMARGLAPA
jgi:2-polyprenyl-6-methoxyphenol hydroxylase-like FAD-dependent oxidoreductase